MNIAAPAMAALAAEIAERSGEFGAAVRLDPHEVMDRSDDLDLQAPGLCSANRTCRLVRAADEWLAVNMPREDDLAAVPAWLECANGVEPWSAIADVAPRRAAAALLERARLLGLPVARVGEVKAEAPDAPMLRAASGAEEPRRTQLRVIDLSSMWAGPLCGMVFADMGADVVKMESERRPDGLRRGSPRQYKRLNGAKREQAFDMDDSASIERLRVALNCADMVITSARARAFESRGLSPQAIFTNNPRLVWVAITGYGWMGHGADRVAFGDDAAAAGALLRWTGDGEPRFAGDALADPITGLAAAVGALRALRLGGGYFIDAVMARCAAGAAHLAAQRAHAE